MKFIVAILPLLFAANIAGAEVKSSAPNGFEIIETVSIKAPAKQVYGALGKIGNCQVAVSSAVIADARTWPLTFELYLPQSWITDPARREAAKIPAPVRFREK